MVVFLVSLGSWPVSALAAEDVTPPEITCPDPVTVECGASLDPALNPELGVATATDDVDPDPVVTYADGSPAGICPAVITRTWTATDNQGLSDTCTQTITVQDGTAPLLEGVPSDIIVECPEDIPGPAKVTASDECDGPLDVVFTMESDGQVCPETITRTWTATDGCGNPSVGIQTLTVRDTTPPDLAVGADWTLQGDDTCSVAVPALEFDVDDNCDPFVTLVQNPPPGTILTGPGRFPITLTATDDCGNDTVETSGLFVECDGGLGDYVWLDSNGDGLQGDPALEPGAPETEVLLLNESGNVIDSTITDSEGLYQFQVQPGTYTLEFVPPIGFSFTAPNVGGDDTVDSDADPATGRTGPVTVGPNEFDPGLDAGLICGPSIDCPPDVVLECTPTPDTSPAATGVPAVNGCCDIVFVGFDDNLVESECGASRMISRQWTAVDACEQSVGCTQTISLICCPAADDPDEDCLCSSEGDNCATVANQSQLDTDEDGIGDACDNCRYEANTDCPPDRGCTGGQLDDDLDGYGNVCDGDFTEGQGDGFVNVDDLLRFLDAFGRSVTASTCPDRTGALTGSCARYDLTAEGKFINVSDLLVIIGPIFGTDQPSHGCAEDDTGIVRCPLP